VSLASQAVGVKEGEDGIWLVSFMNYDLGYLDMEEKTSKPLENPSGQKCNLCLRNGQRRIWLRGVDLNHRPLGYEPNELPGCSTPKIHISSEVRSGKTQAIDSLSPSPSRQSPLSR